MRRAIFALGPVLLWMALAGSGCTSREAKRAEFMRNGKQQLAKEEYARAIFQFRNAVVLAPKDAEPVYQLGLAYLGARDYRNAYAAFRKATELDPKHSAAQLKVAELMLGSQNRQMLEQAEQRAKGVLDAQGDSAEALNALAVAELRLGRQEDAEQHLQRALDKFPRDLQSSVILARMRLARKDAPGAEEVLKKAAAQKPPSAAAVLALAEFYSLMRKPAEAQQQFERAVAIDPKNGQAMLGLAGMLIRAGRNDEAEKLLVRVSQLPDKEYKPVHAQYLLRSGKREAGVAELELLSKQDPSDRDARSRLVAAYVAVGRTADAERVLAEALAKNGRDVDSLLQRSTMRLRAGKYAEAQTDLNTVLRFRKDSAEAHYLLSRVHRAHGAMLSQRQELTEAVRLNPGLLAVRLELVELLTATGAAKSALGVLDEAPASQRNLLACVEARNWALLATGDTTQVRKIIDASLKAGVRTPNLMLQDAVLKVNEKNYRGAYGPLDEVLKSQPENLRALNLLMTAYRGDSQPAAGLKKVREHAAAYPSSARIQYFLGELLSSQGDLAGARTALAAALAASPNLVEAELAMAGVDARERKFAEARTRLARVASENPSNARASFLLGTVEEAAGDRGAAIRYYRRAVDTDQNHVAALNNLAYLLADHANQPDEAIKYAQRAKELAPESSEIDDTVGWAYYHKGIYRTALQYLESAAQSNSAVRKYHLAMAYFKAGDEGRARQMLTAAMKINPNVPESRAAQQLISGRGR